MRYPRVNNCLKYYRNPDGTCRIVNYCTNQEYNLSYGIVRILRKMDGRRPLSSLVPVSRQKCDAAEDELLEMGLLRKSRMDVEGPGCVRIAVWMASGRSQKRWKGIAMCLNKFIRTAWLPVLAAGLLAWSYIFLSRLWYDTSHLSPSGYMAGYLVGMLAGGLLHEMAHAASAMAYGAPVFEIGLGLILFLPCGYIIMDESEIKGRTRNTQILLAGIRMNFLLGGSALLLALFIPAAWGFLMGTAFANLITGFINLYIFGPTDGFHTLTTMLGIPQTWDFEDRIRIAFGKQRIRNVKGINSGILRIAMILLMIFQISFVPGILYIAWSLIDFFAG